MTGFPAIFIRKYFFLSAVPNMQAKTGQQVRGAIDLDERLRPMPTRERPVQIDGRAGARKVPRTEETASWYCE